MLTCKILNFRKSQSDVLTFQILKCCRVPWLLAVQSGRSESVALAFFLADLGTSSCPFHP